MALSGPHFTLRGLLLPALPGVKNLKSGSTADAVITNQGFTHGLFKRLDGVIACSVFNDNHHWNSMLALILTAPPRYRQVSTSMLPKKPSFR
jgi:hypothetical protein